MQIYKPETDTKKPKWMTCPKGESEYPSLAYIFPLSELILVKESNPLHELISKTGIGYTIFNNQGQKVFLAIQENRCRNFDVKIYNIYGNEAIEVKSRRKFCLNKVFVWAPPGNFAGSIIQSCGHTFLVKNQSNEVISKIKAQGLFNFTFDILSNNKKIGVIKKQWETAAMVNVKNFGICFPVEFNVVDKAVLIGACFLIGYLKYS